MLFSFFQNVHEIKKSNIGEPEHIYHCSDDDNDADNVMMKKVMTMAIIVTTARVGKMNFSVTGSKS